MIKAIKVSNADLAVADAYFDAADMLLFDAKTPADMKNARPAVMLFRSTGIFWLAGIGHCLGCCLAGSIPTMSPKR